MSKRSAFLGAAAVLAASALPAAAADYYGGDDGYPDGGRPPIDYRGDLRPADGYRRAPGPVVFDERAPDRRFDRQGVPADRRPFAEERPEDRYGDRRPPAFIPPVEPPYGGGYRAAAVAVGPAFEGGYGGPDEGCTVERVRSITPAGWEKTVTHRTCYRR